MRDEMRNALEAIATEYANTGTLEDYQIEWLIEHCTDFMNELHRIQNMVHRVFGEEPYLMGNKVNP